MEIKEEEKVCCFCIDLDTGMIILGVLFSIDFIASVFLGTINVCQGNFFYVYYLISAMPVGYMLYWDYQANWKQDSL